MKKILSSLLVMGTLLTAIGYPAADVAAETTFAQAMALKNPFEPALPQKSVEMVPVELKKPGAPAALPPLEPAITAPALSISGVVWNTDQPQAIINNTIVAVGGTIDGATVLKIERTGVEIFYQGKYFTIPYEPLTAFYQMQNSNNRQKNLRN